MRSVEGIIRYRYVQIVLAVALYWVVSITMVFLNKYLLSSPNLKLDAPLFITWFQCLVTVVICYIIGKCAQWFPSYNFPLIALDFKMARDVFPLSVMFVCMITSNNLTLKYLSVSFYMVGRSLTTVCNVAFTYAILKQFVSIRVIIACVVIVLGFLLGLDQEHFLGSLNWYGVIFGVASSVFVALNAIYTSKCLPNVDYNLWKLTFYNNFNAFVLFIPGILIFGEMPTIVSFNKLTCYRFWLAMIASGILGFSMSLVTGLQVKVTSALTHNISGTAKAYVQTLLAVLWWKETKSFLWWLSNILVLGGSAYYTHVRKEEMNSVENQKSSEDV